MTVKNRFLNWAMPIIKHGELTKYNWLVDYPEGLKLGAYTDIGAFTYIMARSGVVIEEEVEIGSHCSIYSESTIDNKKGLVTLKKGCKIGSHTTIMPNITIGEGAIIGAHSFVNKDVPANCLTYGIPIKIISGRHK